MAGSDDIGGPVFGSREQLIGIGSALAGETALSGVHGELAAHAVAGVGEVAEVGAHDADGHVGVQILVIARAAGGQEVRHVGRSIGARIFPDIHDEIFLVALIDLEAGAIRAHPAIGAVEKIADVVAADLGEIAFAAGIEAADFELQLLVAEVEGGELGVGGFLVVGVEVLAAGGDHALGPRDFAQAAARVIHLMHALIADVAVAGVPEPVPVVLEAQSVEGAHWGGAEEHVPVDAGGDGRILGVADGGAAFETETLGQVDLADHALVEQPDGLDLIRLAAALRTDLHHAAGFAGHFDYAFAVVDVVTGGLFAVDILAGLAGPDGGERVPVVGGGDGDGVDFFIGEELAHIVVALGLCSGQLLGGGLSGFKRGLVDVAEGYDARVGQGGVTSDVIVAASPDAHDADVDFVVGAEHAAEGKCGTGREKRSARWSGHHGLLVVLAIG